MKYPRITAIILVILLAGILLLDAFVIPGKKVSTTIAGLDSKYTETKGSSYTNYFVITSKLNKYEVSERVYSDLEEKDSIFISSSRLFQMPLRIQYNKEGQFFSWAIGQLSSKTSLRYGLLWGMLLMLISLMPFLNKPGINTRIKIILTGLGISTVAVVMLFVLIELLSI